MYKIELKKSKHNWTFYIKLKRVLWMVVSPLFFNYFGRFFSPLRIFLLRCFGANIGKECLILQNVKIWMPWNLSLGDFVAIGRHVELYNFGRISIGHNVTISQYSFLCTASHDYSKRNFPLIWKDITIEDYSWVAAKAFIGPGVHLGEGSIVGAYSVVTKSLQGWKVYAGNPCVELKNRILNDVE